MSPVAITHLRWATSPPAHLVQPWLACVQTAPTLSYLHLEFNQYLNEEGLTEVIKTRERFGLSDAPGRENFSRCAKSIILVDGQSQGYDKQIDPRWSSSRRQIL